MGRAFVLWLRILLARIPRFLDSFCVERTRDAFQVPGLSIRLSPGWNAEDLLGTGDGGAFHMFGNTDNCLQGWFSGASILPLHSSSVPGMLTP